MCGRQTIRGKRRPVVIDLILLVAIVSLLMSGFRELLGENLHGGNLRVALLSLFGIPGVAILYGIASAIEMRSGWIGSSLMTGLLHAALVLSSVCGIPVLAVLSPSAAVMTLASVSALLLWSSSWA